ncbi:MAG: sigma-54 dependent transcriptional regulator [Cellvibrionaceae bacterium]
MTATPHALIIDDEPDICELLSISLSQLGISSQSVHTVTDAKTAIKDNDFQVCLTDMRLPDGDGMEVVNFLQKHNPDLPVAVITAHGNMDLAIEAMQAGAFDFVSKPVELERLNKLVTTAIKLSKAESKDTSEVVLLGDSDVMEKLRKQTKKLARSQAPVFINGESGVGKELVSRAIHYHGPRASGPFIPVNCGAIPKELMESEFFGHAKGSFTGAHQDKQGLFQAADGGTLFLDEVADLPLDMQVKLLRAIQEKAIRPVGGQQEIQVDIRILSATHKNLEQEIQQNRFRSDLFYRINVIQLNVPPLRDRISDITLLSERFLLQFAKESGLPCPSLSKDAQNDLKAYSFPGNVRELENILERAFTMCEDDEIEAEDLNLPKSIRSTDSSLFSSTQTNLDINEITSIDDYLEVIERDIIHKALEKNRWNKTKTAEKLGISFRQMRYRLKKLGLEDS